MDNKDSPKKEELIIDFESTLEGISRGNNNGSSIFQNAESPRRTAVSELECESWRESGISTPRRKTSVERRNSPDCRRKSRISTSPPQIESGDPRGTAESTDLRADTSKITTARSSGGVSKRKVEFEITDPRDGTSGVRIRRSSGGVSARVELHFTDPREGTSGVRIRRSSGGVSTRVELHFTDPRASTSSIATTCEGTSSRVCQSEGMELTSSPSEGTPEIATPRSTVADYETDPGEGTSSSLTARSTNGVKRARRSEVSPPAEQATATGAQFHFSSPDSENRVMVPTAPSEWNQEHIVSWLNWCSEQFDLFPKPDPSLFPQSGSELCSLSRAHFEEKLGNKRSAKYLALHLGHLQQYATGKALSPSLGDTSDEDDPYELLAAATGRILSQCQYLNASSGSSGVQLWQFLLELLSDSSNSGCIAWEGTDGQFKLIDPEEVARRWGVRKSRPNMNYEKLSRALRYYYDKSIMTKVQGQRYAYKFDFQALTAACHNEPSIAPPEYSAFYQASTMFRSTASTAVQRQSENTQPISQDITLRGGHAQPIGEEEQYAQPITAREQSSSERIPPIDENVRHSRDSQ